jgi:flap endonuclease-1
MEQFIDLCILAGCDYCNTIRGAMSRRRGTGARVCGWDSDRTTAHAGVGPKRALALIQQHGSIETVIKNLDKAKNPLPDQFPFEATRELFKHPNVPHHPTPHRVRGVRVRVRVLCCVCVCVT